MHLTLNLGTSYKTDLFILFLFRYDFMFDRIMSVLVRVKVRGHLVMSIIHFMNLISVHFWTYPFVLVKGSPLDNANPEF